MTHPSELRERVERARGEPEPTEAMITAGFEAYCVAALERFQDGRIDQGIESGMAAAYKAMRALSKYTGVPTQDAGRAITGELLCEAFAETFNGGGWADAPVWADFDEEQQARWNAAAEWLASASRGAGEPTAKDETT